MMAHERDGMLVLTKEFYARGCGMMGWVWGCSPRHGKAREVAGLRRLNDDADGHRTGGEGSVERLE